MITSSNLKSLRILDFYQVLKNINAHIAKHTLAQPKIAARATALEQAVNELDAVLKPLRTSASTAKLNEQDRRRDQALVGFAAQLRSFSKHFSPEVRDAAWQLKITLEKYGKSPQQLPLREETAMISQFLNDLKKPENAAALAKLHAESWTVELAEANSVFETIYNERSEEGATVEVGAVKAARVKAQKAFDDFAKGINAYEELNETEEYRPLSDEVNFEVKKAKSSIKPGEEAAENPKA